MSFLAAFWEVSKYSNFPEFPGNRAKFPGKDFLAIFREIPGWESNPDRNSTNRLNLNGGRHVVHNFDPGSILISKM